MSELQDSGDRLWVSRGPTWRNRTALFHLCAIAFGCYLVDGALRKNQYDLQFTSAISGLGCIAVGAFMFVRAFRHSDEAALAAGSETLCVNALGFRPCTFYSREEPIEFEARRVWRLGYILRFRSRNRGSSMLIVRSKQLAFQDPESLRRMISDWRTGESRSG